MSSIRTARKSFHGVGESQFPAEDVRHNNKRVQVGRPIIKVLGRACELACINDGVGMKSRNKEIPIEPIHSPAEPYQAIEDVLAVEQRFEPGEPFRVDNR
jgi:hypothetical protein